MAAVRSNFIYVQLIFVHFLLFQSAADEYFLTRLPIANLRLAQGGVRLAAILNRIFTP